MAPVPQRHPIIGGNWKMNLDRASAVALAEGIVAGRAEAGPGCDVAVFPPFPYLEAVGAVLRGGPVALGAQDVSPEPSGAFTGEVSTAMLLDLGVTVVLVGHSERRHVIGEDDSLVNAKLRATLAAGLDAVLCVGETMEQREAGRTREVIEGQLEAGLAGVEIALLGHLVIAYEPVWAIGTGRTATPDDADEGHAVLRECLGGLYDPLTAAAVRIQYGGSVKPQNAGELIDREQIDGFLVGGASLKIDSFLEIIRAATMESSHREAENA